MNVSLILGKLVYFPESNLAFAKAGLLCEKRHSKCNVAHMNIKELEAAALELLPKDRVHLAEKLLESLEDSQDTWVEEAQGVDVPWNS